MRSEYLFNHDWLYLPQEAQSNTPDNRFTAVTLPHSNIELPWHNFDDKEYQFISSYRKYLKLPEAANGRRIYLDFEGVMSAATVTINGHRFEEHKGGFIPFSYDITDYLKDGENLLEVTVDSRERGDIPPHGGQVDYLVFGGIYRDVHLRYVNPVHFKSVQVKTYDVLTDRPRVVVELWVKNQSSTSQTFFCGAGFEYAEYENWEDESKGEIAANSEQKFTLEMSGNRADIRLWSVDMDKDNPALYVMAGELQDETGANLDHFEVTFGFREAVFKEDGFYLNGEKLFLRGLNRHQMYPFVGMAVSQRLQARDAEIIKNFGCNIVRSSHYPQSHYFLDRCDEIGLLVFDEIPGWQHIGNEDWQALSHRDIRAMIERDWNHPSVILWSIRINESWDNEAFYIKSNAIARELDPTRPTTGVRFFPHSQFLEDVFAYNDFSNGIIEPTQSPWLVSEYNGHMYSTKTWDNEERQQEHMLRHARVQSLAMAMGGLSGAIGWCAFDYNTHQDFGSGDRVCYHGVMDMWRQPKWAAYVYRSQKSPQDEVVLQVASHWTMGDRAGGGNSPLYVLTNCDEIDVWVGATHHGRFSAASDEFPSLPHPPIKVKGLGLDWGSKFAMLRVVGYIGGKQVAEQIIEGDSIPRKLEFYAEDTQLKADGMDMTRLVFKLVDNYGNRLPYAIQTVDFELLEGDAQLIGENPFALVGGQAALLLRAGQKKGKVRIMARARRVAPVEITVELT
jgi:beta-galactosidase